MTAHSSNRILGAEGVCIPLIRQHEDLPCLVLNDLTAGFQTMFFQLARLDHSSGERFASCNRLVLRFEVRSNKATAHKHYGGSARVRVDRLKPNICRDLSVSLRGQPVKTFISVHRKKLHLHSWALEKVMQL